MNLIILNEDDAKSKPKFQSSIAYLLFLYVMSTYILHNPIYKHVMCEHHMLGVRKCQSKNMATSVQRGFRYRENYLQMFGGSVYKKQLYNVYIENQKHIVVCGIKKDVSLFY